MVELTGVTEKGYCTCTAWSVKYKDLQLRFVTQFDCNGDSGIRPLISSSDYRIGRRALVLVSGRKAASSAICSLDMLKAALIR